MQAEIQTKFNDIDQAINILKKHFNWENSLNRIKEFNDLVESKNFWNEFLEKVKLVLFCFAVLLSRQVDNWTL